MQVGEHSFIREGRSFSLVGHGVLGAVGLLDFDVVLVEVHELGQIELRLLEELDLADHAVVLEREDLAALLLDLFANVVSNAANQKINNFNFDEKTLQNSQRKIN